MGDSSSFKRDLLITAAVCVAVIGVVVGVIYTAGSGDSVAIPGSSAGPGDLEIALERPSAGALEIVSALWRVKDRPDFDATAKIAGMVRNGELRTKVGAAALGVPAPPPGVTGTLVLRYRVNGIELTRSTRGGGTMLNIVAPPLTGSVPNPVNNSAPAPTTRPGGLEIAQGTPPAGSLEIVNALWQIRDRPDFDATAQIAAMVKDGALNIRVNWETLGLPKPPQGVTATLALRYRVNGIEQTRSTRGGGTNLSIVAPPLSLSVPEPSLAAGPATTRATATPIADDAKTFTNSLEVKFVRIEPGEFMMGTPDIEPGRDIDEGPQFKVRITRAYFLQSTEVTQKQWLAVMGNNPSSFKGDDLPVERVTWADAVAFCRKLSETEGRTYRLPTEAEWEYACRAGTIGPIPANLSLDDVAWHKGNSDRQSHPVGTKQPNPWGLYDMLGNVVEWCSDWYGPYAGGEGVDPTGAATGSLRVLRGGSWYVDSTCARAGDRHGYPPIGRFASNVGFRPVLEFQ